MAYSEFYAESGGSAMNGGSNSGALIFTQTNGNWSTSTNNFICSNGTNISAVTAGMFASVFIDGATTPVYIARVTSISGSGGASPTISLSSTAKAGTAPTTSASGRTIIVGGAWALPSGTSTYPLLPLSSFSSATNSSGDVPRINCKSGGSGGIDCAMTGTITNNVNGPYVIQGYKTSVGDGETNTDTQANQVNYKCRLDGGSSSIVLYTVSATDVCVADFQFSNNAGSNNGVTWSGARGLVLRTIIHDVQRVGLSISGAGTRVVESEFYICGKDNSAAFAGTSTTVSTTYERCYAHDCSNTSTGFLIQPSTASTVFVIDRCISDTNGGHGLQFTQSAAISAAITSSDFFNNASDGINLSPSVAGGSIHIENCNFENNGQTSGTGYGINRADSQKYFLAVANPSFFNNKTGTTNALIGSLTGSITNSGSAYNAPTTGDFRPLGAGGANVKGAGRGRFLQTGSSKSGTVGYPDTVAAQHQDTGGGGGYIWQLATQ